jgi:hypothetical protein
MGHKTKNKKTKTNLGIRKKKKTQIFFPKNSKPKKAQKTKK